MAKFFNRLQTFCKRRGFIIELPCPRGCSEKHVYGPLGAELKRNIISEWWHAVVTSTTNMYGISSNACTPQSGEDRQEDGTRSSKACSETVSSDTVLCMLEAANCLSVEPPYGTASVGRISRDDTVSKYSLLQTREMECMCVQFLCPPAEERQWFSHWQKNRLRWWRKLSRNPEKFCLGEGVKGHADYKQQCSIQYEFPWGSQDVESIKNRGDRDFRQLAQRVGDDKLGSLGVRGEHAFPSLISMASGVDEAVLTYLCDAYSESERPHASHGRDEQGLATVLNLHISLAPYKLAMLPTAGTNSKLCMYSNLLSDELRHSGVSTVYSEDGPLHIRLTRQDEVGTPYRVITDEGTLETGIVTLQERDTTGKEAMNGRDVLPSIQQMLFGARTN